MMTEIFRDRAAAETNADKWSCLTQAPYAVFSAIHFGRPVTCSCPLTEFGEPADLIAIYEPRS